MNRTTFASMMVGVILGTSIMFLVQGRMIDQLRRDNEKMSQEILDLDSENQLLVAKLNQTTPKEMIEKIVVEVRNAPTGLSQLDVTKFVKSQLDFLVGSELSALKRQPDLPSRLVDGRPLVVDQIEYKIRVNYVVVSEQLFISVTPIPDTNG